MNKQHVSYKVGAEFLNVIQIIPGLENRKLATVGESLR
jgi:hypothetical protein